MTNDPFDPDDKAILDDDLVEDLGADADDSTDRQSEDADVGAATTSTDEETLEEETFDDENNGSRDWEAGAKSVGETAGEVLGSAVLLPPRLLVNGIVGTTVGFTRVIPGAQRIWSKVIKIGYGGYYKTSGADVVGHIMKEGRLKHVPLTWSNEDNRFEGPGENEWWLSPGENEHTLLGPNNTPCAWGASKSTNLGTQVQAEVAEALDFGYGTQVWEDADVSIRNVFVNEDGAAGAGQEQAVADGGSQLVDQYVSVDDPGMLQDVVVDLSQIYRDEDTGDVAEGRLVSMLKYYETYPETVDSEEMKKQEDRGRLAEMDQSEKMKFAIKMMLLAALIIAIVVLGPDALRMLLGNGNGGGGGGIGLMLRPVAAALGGG